MEGHLRLHPIRLSLTGLALALIACGPPGVGNDADSAEETSASSGPEPSTSTTTTDDSSTTTDETGPEPSTSTTNSSFVPEDDHVLEPCDPWREDCPEGEKCVPYASDGGASWDSTKCVPITGDQAPGEACVYGGAAEATDDCQLGSMCWYVEELDGQLLGECVSLCTGSPEDPTCPADYACTISGDGVLTLCLPTCDPLLQDCGVGQGCWWSGGTDQFMCIPAATPGLEPGAACGFINDCAPGSMCVSPDAVPDCVDAAGCCAPFCELNLGDAPCEASLPGTACVAFFVEGEAPPGYEQVGVCVVP